MKISESVFMLSIAAPVLGKVDTIHPTLLGDEDRLTLIDTGFPRQLPQLREQIEGAGFSSSQIRRILMTHQDIDHIGNLQDLAEELAGQAQILAHELEKPYIQGDRMLLRFTPEALASIDKLPPEVPASFREGLKRLMLHPPKARVDSVIEDGQRLPIAGGLIAIATPGHTPGHLSFYHEPSRTLIAGDALTADQGRLSGPDPHTTLDMAEALRSLKKLGAYDIAQAICYHGGLCTGRLNERIAELADS